LRQVELVTGNVTQRSWFSWFPVEAEDWTQ